MKCWVKKNRWKNFPRARAGSIDDDVASCTAEINRIVEKLQVSMRKIQRSEVTDEWVFLTFFSIPSSGGTREKLWNECILLSLPLPIYKMDTSLRTQKTGIMR